MLNNVSYRKRNYTCIHLDDLVSLSLSLVTFIDYRIPAGSFHRASLILSRKGKSFRLVFVDMDVTIRSLRSVRIIIIVITVSGDTSLAIDVSTGAVSSRLLLLLSSRVVHATMILVSWRIVIIKFTKDKTLM